MELSRQPSQNEAQLLELLIQKSAIDFPADWDSDLLVKPLSDGGMGSLLLLPKGVKENCNRMLGQQVSEYQFADVDGIDVIASLNVDNQGKLFELDIWKTDFTPLMSIPPQLTQANS